MTRFCVLRLLPAQWSHGATLTAGVKLDDKHAETRALLGTPCGTKTNHHLLRAAGFGPKVVKNRDLALAVGPDNPWVRYLLGMCEFHTASKPTAGRADLNSFLTAEKLFAEEAKRANSAFEPRWGRSSYLTFIERTYERLGETTKATDYFRQALAEYPLDHEARPDGSGSRKSSEAHMKSKKVIVIGAGLGGLSAAISLKQSGYDVEIFEKNAQIGGKLNVLKQQGYTFDLGPSILTLPHIFERLFERSGKKMSDYFSIRPLRPHWRNFFEDGKVVDLYPEPEKMAAEARKVGEPPENIDRFLKYSADLYDLTNDGYFEQGLDNWQGFAKHYGLFKFFQFDLFRSMHQGVAAHLQTEYFRNIFDFFIKYVGSSAYRAPAFMNSMPTIQFRYDLWYVDGGLYHIALGLKRLMEELGIKVNLNAEVSEVRRENGRVTGLVSNGEFHAADIIVSNMEVIPAYEKLLNEDKTFIASLEKKLEPTCSGLVIELGLDRQYPQLAHHNFFFSGHQKEHFAKVFERYELPDDPTIYLVAASKTDPTVAPAGCDCLKILPHIPHIDDAHPLTREDYSKLKERILDKLERMGLKNLRKHVVFEHFWTPLDIRAQYNSNKGSIYGVVSDRWKNLAFKAPKQSTLYPNLFFVGGSVNPGGGMPMVVLCGQNVAKKVVAWDRH